MRKPYDDPNEPEYWSNVMYGVSGGYVAFAILERLVVKYCLKGKRGGGGGSAPAASPPAQGEPARRNKGNN